MAALGIGLVAVGVTHVPLYAALVIGRIWLLVLGLAALVTYLLFLFSGRRGAWIPGALVYGAFALWATTVYLRADLVAVGEIHGMVRLRWANPPPASLNVALALLMGVPVLAAAMAYGSLFFRLRDRSRRYRVALLSLALFVWVGVNTILTRVATGLPEWWQTVNHALALVAPLVILAAMRPPAWVQARFGIRPFQEIIPPEPIPLDEVNPALAQRIRELV